jgi:hypothetical protein
MNKPYGEVAESIIALQMALYKIGGGSWAANEIVLSGQGFDALLSLVASDDTCAIFEEDGKTQIVIHGTLIKRDV